jgi:hypothetical protein
VAVGDFDLNGKPDFVSANYGGPSVSVRSVSSGLDLVMVMVGVEESDLVFHPLHGPMASSSSGQRVPEQRHR